MQVQECCPVRIGAHVLVEHSNFAPPLCNLWWGSQTPELGQLAPLLRDLQYGLTVSRRSRRLAAHMSGALRALSACWCAGSCGAGALKMKATSPMPHSGILHQGHSAAAGPPEGRAREFAHARQPHTCPAPCAHCARVGVQGSAVKMTAQCRTATSQPTAAAASYTTIDRCVNTRMLCSFSHP
jgi:hypothetical protein